MTPMMTLRLIGLFLPLALASLAPATTNTLRVYVIGNSVTDTVRYGELAKLAAARDVKLDWGRTMIPGAPLEWIYSHPNDGFQQEVLVQFENTWAIQLRVNARSTPVKFNNSVARGKEFFGSCQFNRGACQSRSGLGASNPKLRESNPR